MNGVPTGWLVTIAVVAALLAALLTAGEVAVLRIALVPDRAPAGARRRGIFDDPPGTAAAAAAVAVVLQVVAAVSLTIALVSAGLLWWRVLLVALVVVGSVALVVVGFAPRTFGARFPVVALTVTSGLLAAARGLAKPLGRVLVAHRRPLTDAELREMMDRASESELIEDEEREMFRSVLELGDTITRAVMVPRTEMITLTSGTPLRKALALFLKSGYSRVPVVGASVDDVLGVLYLKDVVRHVHTIGDADALVDDLVREPVFVPESKPVDDLLREMQQGASHMAMVVDEFGGIAGLVTIEDALEEIVGEVTDEHDRAAPEVEDLGQGVFRVPSRLPLDELGELFGLEIDDDDVDTAGGLLAKALGKVPLAGSSAEVAGLRLTADRVQGRRKQVATLLVRGAAVEGDVK
jgi:CBS domain containing-hemolysin-like protein